jgi:hypothetical protein
MLTSVDVAAALMPAIMAFPMTEDSGSGLIVNASSAH